MSSTAVGVYTHVHSYNYVTNQLLNSIKEIVRMSGLEPGKMSGQWASLELGVHTWLADGDLKAVHLEVYHSQTDELVRRWDFDIYYGNSGDGSFWQDPEDIRYHIEKAGLNPANCDYEILITTAPGRRDVMGWSRSSFRSTDGFVRQSIGTTIGAGGIAAGTSYWRKK